jgi:hypothetical protein
MLQLGKVYKGVSALPIMKENKNLKATEEMKDEKEYIDALLGEHQNDFLDDDPEVSDDD